MMTSNHLSAAKNADDYRENPTAVAANDPDKLWRIDDMIKSLGLEG